jgi:hypothetical protein
MSDERRRRWLSVLLALQGALILAGAVLLGATGSVIAPFDNFVGTDASVAAVVLGAGFILAFRRPRRVWCNLAIMYNGLVLLVQVVKYSQNLGVRLTPAAAAISTLFLVLFIVFYPRGVAEIEAAG